MECNVVSCSGSCSWNCYKACTFCSLWARCTIPCACYTKRHLVQKCSEPVSAFTLLNWKCTSRHNRVQFFNISTSKSGPNMQCFVHVDFEMCFAPQQCALFQHLNFQKLSERGVLCTFWLRNVLRATTACTFECSERGVFCTFWLRNVPRATTACTFSTSQLPKVVRDRQFLTLLTSKCASRHNGVRFFDISTSKSGRPRTRRISDPTFRPSGATNNWKNA